jgi:tetratricopeptide (TPR) repeat protein
MAKLRRLMGLSVLILGVFALLLASSSPGMAQPRPMDVDILTPLNRGYDLMADGKYDLAKQEFEKVIKADPYNPIANNNLAAIAERQGQTPVALGYLKSGMEKVGEYPYRVDKQVCFAGGLCTAIKPVYDPDSRHGPTGQSVAAVLGDNLKKLSEKKAK